MSRAELRVLKKWLEEGMLKVFIHQSSPHCAAPVRFAKKPDWGLWLCIDYRDINSKRINDRYPLPPIKERLNHLGKAQIYTKVDIQEAYNLHWVKEGDEHELAFRTRYGRFEWTATQFGMRNAPVDIQGCIKNTIREVLDESASAYLDDVVITVIRRRNMRVMLSGLCNGYWMRDYISSQRSASSIRIQWNT